MKIQTKRDISFFIAAVLASAVAGVFLYRPFFIFLDPFFGPITGPGGINIPPSEVTDPIIAIFDFSYLFFLALFLSFPFEWKETLRYWAYGYLLLIALSLLAAGIYIPDPLRLLFNLLSASVGFLIGQGIKFLITQRKWSK